MHTILKIEDLKIDVKIDEHGLSIWLNSSKLNDGISPPKKSTSFRGRLEKKIFQSLHVILLRPEMVCMRAYEPIASGPPGCSLSQFL